MNLELLLLSLPVLIFSIVVHEVAHGWVALKQGDQTALMLGRLTFNPVPHIDPIGSLLVPAFLALTGAGVIFGWARPVPVNPRNFRNYKKGDILVSLAGVAANLILAFAFAFLWVAVLWLQRGLPAQNDWWAPMATMFQYGVGINLVLMVFNLVPIPPLDGSHVFYYLLPPDLGARYRAMGMYGMFIVFGFLVLGGFAILMPIIGILGRVVVSVAGIFAPA
ncbi:MAG: site-2 protease family protein [Gemmatimonadetes bacterium]|nr:site-2 protease family protein [Gemmatimonadota bacterium]